MSRRLDDGYEDPEYTQSMIDMYRVNIREFIDKIPKVIQPSQDQIVSNLKESYNNEKLVLVLGAGISRDFGIPTWNNLLQKLMVYTIGTENGETKILSELFNKTFTPNPLIAARFLQNHFNSSDLAFELKVREVLYQEVNKALKTNLLDEIVKLCIAKNNSRNLDSIITYNFDDILEHYLRTAGLDISFKSIFAVGQEVKNKELPIYHVHGFLPHIGSITSKNKIILGEINYHEQYYDVYSWNNIVQINKFKEKTCLFVGSSLTDPNIRRLLDVAHKQKAGKKNYHYVFKQRIDKPRIENKLNEIVHSDLKNEINISDLQNFNERFEEYDSESFGVQTIWIDHWDEVPKFLKRIRES